MSKNKTGSMNIFQIFLESIVIYFKNFIPLSKAMLFPVFGQLIGIIYILYSAYLFSNYINKFSAQTVSNNIILILLSLIVILLPGFFVFCKAFWDYLVVMVSLNSMVANITRQGHIKDINVHNQATKLRSKEYIILLLVLTLIWVVGLTIPALVFLFKNPFKIEPVSVAFGFIGLEIAALFILFIISIYLSLCFQVFAFENISTLNILKKSWELVEGNFWRTLFLGIILFVVTGIVIPGIFQTIIENTALINPLIKPFKAYVTIMAGSPERLLQFTQSTTLFGKPLIPDYQIMQISRSVALSTVGSIITAFLLPLGSACYTLLYYDILGKKAAKTSSKSKKKNV